MKRITVLIGDVHGCLDEFTEMLNAIQYDPNQMRVILLGDLMDRGPEQVACVRKARELNLECVKGNHEEKHIRWRKHEKNNQKSGRQNPMKPMLEHDLNAHNQLSDEDFTWIKNLPLKIQIEGTWWAVHAGMEPAFDLAGQRSNQIIRVRYVDDKGLAQALGPQLKQPEGTKYWTEMWKGPESIVYGHCVHSKISPRVDKLKGGIECIGLDTGCVFGGRLSAVLMDFSEEKVKTEFVQVQAKKVYFKGYDE